MIRSRRSHRIAALLGIGLFLLGVALAEAIPSGPGMHVTPSVSLSGADEDDVAEVYRLYCSTCHGDVGQGLTDEWRSTHFPPSKQNCWQSKCHTYNHDPGGFIFPKEVPAIVGTEALTKFATAQELYGFIRAAMPYYAPGLLSDTQYRELTIYLVEANYRARNLSLPEQMPEELAAMPLQTGAQGVTLASEPTAPNPPVALAALAALAGLGGIGGVWRRARQRSSHH